MCVLGLLCLLKTSKPRNNNGERSPGGVRSQKGGPAKKLEGLASFAEDLLGTGLRGKNLILLVFLYAKLYIDRLSQARDYGTVCSLFFVEISSCCELAG